MFLQELQGIPLKKKVGMYNIVQARVQYIMLYRFAQPFVTTAGASSIGHHKFVARRGRARARD
jgi:hypothetical protein